MRTMNCFVVRFASSAAAMLLMIVLAASGTAWAGPPQAKYLYPAGAQRGESVTLTVGGSFSHWPPAVFQESDQLTVAPLEKKGELQVTVKTEAPPGVYWLRFHDREGATSPRPFLVGTLPETKEVEPNNDPLRPQSIEQSSVVNGRLSKRDDVDTYSFHLETGQQLIASLAAHDSLASPMDAVLQVCNADGFVLAQNNDARGLDPRIRFTADEAGEYLVRAFAFPAQPNSTIGFAGDDDYVYRLTLTTGGFLYRAMPLAVPAGKSTEVELIGWNFDPLKQTLSAEAPERHVTVFEPKLTETVQLPVARHRVVLVGAEAAGEGQLITLPVDLSGCLQLPNQRHVFRFTAQKNDKLQFRVEARSLGFPTDAVLELIDLASGKVLAENDDTNKQPDPTLSLTIKSDGEYELRLRDLHDRGGMRFAYRLMVQPAEPGYTLSIENKALMIKPGESLEVPVTIDRQQGYDREIEITALDLPAGVTASTQTSAAKGDSAKQVKLKLTASADAKAGLFRIRGVSKQESPLTRVATFSVEGFNKAFEKIALVVAEAEESK